MILLGVLSILFITVVDAALHKSDGLVISLINDISDSSLLIIRDTLCSYGIHPKVIIHLTCLGDPESEESKKYKEIFEFCPDIEYKTKAINLLCTVGDSRIPPPPEGDALKMHAYQTVARIFYPNKNISSKDILNGNVNTHNSILGSIDIDVLMLILERSRVVIANLQLTSKFLQFVQYIPIHMQPEIVDTSSTSDEIESGSIIDSNKMSKTQARKTIARRTPNHMFQMLFKGAVERSLSLRAYNRNDHHMTVAEPKGESISLVERSLWASKQGSVNMRAWKEEVITSKGNCNVGCVSYDTQKVLEEIAEVASINSHSHIYSNKKEMRNNRKVLCLTYTYKERLPNARGIANTWGSRCDGYLAFTYDDVSDYEFAIQLIRRSGDNHIHLDSESYDNMWLKTIMIWTTIARADLIDHYDYFLLGGDDLFVHVDNLYDLLSISLVDDKHKAGEPLYIGRKGHQNAYMDYALGGAGYILNREAVKYLVSTLLIPGDSYISTLDVMGPNPCSFLASVNSALEDLLVGYCMKHRDITLLHVDGTYLKGGDGRNSNTSLLQGIDIFHPVDLLEARNITNDYLRFQMVYNMPAGIPPSMTTSDIDMNESKTELPKGSQCCSPRTITWQNVKTESEMYCTAYILWGINSKH